MWYKGPSSTPLICSALPDSVKISGCFRTQHLWFLCTSVCSQRLISMLVLWFSTHKGKHNPCVSSQLLSDAWPSVKSSSASALTQYMVPSICHELCSYTLPNIQFRLPTQHSCGHAFQMGSHYNTTVCTNTSALLWQTRCNTGNQVSLQDWLSVTNEYSQYPKRLLSLLALL
jgi:hypothetical protein